MQSLAYVACRKLYKPYRDEEYRLFVARFQANTLRKRDGLDAGLRIGRSQEIYGRLKPNHGFVSIVVTHLLSSIRSLFCHSPVSEVMILSPSFNPERI